MFSLKSSHQLVEAEVSAVSAPRPLQGWHGRRRGGVRLATLGVTLALLAGVASLRADEFTVQHTYADYTWQTYGIYGSGIGVAVLDSGVDTGVPDLSGRIVANVNFAAGVTGTNDACGHGTHVAGIIAGNGYASSGSQAFHNYCGTAPQARIINARVLNGIGQGNVSDVISAIQWCINNKATYNIRVMNLSLGHPVGESYTTDPLCLAVKNAWNAGITVVCAAGNAGRLQNTQNTALDNGGYGTNYGSIQSPGNSPYVITVGALKQDPNIPDCYYYDDAASYSSRGPTRLDYVLKPDIMAPGNKVIAPINLSSYLGAAYASLNKVGWQEYLSQAPANSAYAYFRLSGTSMAAPVVSGTAALMLQRCPNITPNTVKARMMITADKMVQPNGRTNPNTYGAGILCAYCSVTSNYVANGPALSPRLYLDSAGRVVLDKSSILTYTNGTNVIWGVNGVTDLNVIWGTNIIWGNGSNVLSSTDLIQTQNVWRDNVIWGTANANVDLSGKAILGD